MRKILTVKELITALLDYNMDALVYTNANGMYNNNFDNDRFFNWLNNIDCKWALSYDGKSGNEDNTFEVPKHLYDEHYYLPSGNSSFKRLKETDKNAMVYESLYIKN